MPIHHEKSASRYILVTLAVLMFVTVMFLVILQSSIIPSGKVFRTYKDGYTDGFKRARELAYGAGLPRQTSLTALSGKVASVGSAEVIFDASGLVLDAAVDAVGITRTARVTKSTVIVSLTPLPASEYVQRQKAYVEKLRQLKPYAPLPAPPSAFRETRIALRDIKPSDSVAVTSAGGENILPLAAFNAAKISVMSR